MRRQAPGLAAVVLLAACALLPETWGDRVPTIAPDVEANRPVVTSWPDGVTLAPVSVRGALIGQPYGYDMPHCGLQSPIDIDGSFWDAPDVQGDPVAFDGQSGVFVLVDADHAMFTTRDGSLTVALVRHDGPKRFPYCA
jgi:hypothetical protein